jgi:hypothetical protein
MISEGFKNSEAEPCIYIRHGGTPNALYVALFVDDINITGPSHSAREEFITTLKSKFDMKDLGELDLCLGLKFIRNKDEKFLLVSQKHYTKEILELFGMQDSHPVSTPMLSGLHLSKSMSPCNEEERNAMKSIPYRTAVGKLIYLSIMTRPDIAFAVGEISRFVQDPGMQHWEAVKRILRYLNGTIDMGLVFDGKLNDIPTLTAYADADWGGNIDDRKSKSGYAAFFCGGCISWRSKFQSCVALSTVEAEYISACEAGREVKWLKKIAEELGYSQGTVIIHEDNQGCISNTKDSLGSEQMKHVNIKYHWIKEECERGEFKLVYCKTQDMTADTLTKSLVSDLFIRHREGLGVKHEKTVKLEGVCQKATAMTSLGQSRCESCLASLASLV